MKTLVSAVVLLGLLAGAAQADSAASKQAQPRGVVTVEEIPTVVVEARWTAADKAAFEKAQASAAAKAGTQVTDKISRGPEYAMH